MQNERSPYPVFDSTDALILRLDPKSVIIAASRTPPWLASGWGCRGFRRDLKTQGKLLRVPVERVDLLRTGVAEQKR